MHWETKQDAELLAWIAHIRQTGEQPQLIL